MTVNCIKNLFCDVPFPFLYLHSLESVFRSATLANDVPCRVTHRPAENEKNFKSRAQAAVYQELFVFHLLSMLSFLSFISFLARFRPISVIKWSPIAIFQCFGYSAGSWDTSPRWANQGMTKAQNPAPVVTPCLLWENEFENKAKQLQQLSTIT